MTSKQEIFAAESKHVLQTYKRQPVVFVRGKGCYLYDVEGHEYLDLVAGVAVNTLGHCHPKWVEAVIAQAQVLVHTSNLYYTEPMVRLAEELSRLSGMERVFFCNSGAEANETAIKIARKWGKKKRGAGCYRIISFERGFHGRTLGALSATGTKKYCEPFEPLVPGFVQTTWGEIDKLRGLLDESVCAVIIEPIQGEGGVWPIEPSLIQSLRALCNEQGVLLICDEVQTGIGRTGKWFGYQHANVLPDLVPLAKGLGGGYPIGACLARGEAADLLVPGDHGSTFAGSPLACAAALAVLKVMQDEKLLDSVNSVGAAFRHELGSLCKEFPDLLDHVRGVGLMLALEFKRPVAKQAVAAALPKGLILNATGDTTLRFVPPLIFTLADLKRAIAALKQTLEECEIK